MVNNTQQAINNSSAIRGCAACARPRAITTGYLLDGAQIAGAATAVEATVNGAQTLSF